MGPLLRHLILLGALGLTLFRALCAVWPFAVVAHVAGDFAHLSLGFITLLLLLADLGDIIRNRRLIPGARITPLLLALLSVVVMQFAYWPLRRIALHRAASRLQPLALAIRTFEQQNGRAPAELDELIPAYIQSVPSTGSPAYHFISYDRHSDTRWELCVWTPRGIVSFDQLCFDPGRAAVTSEPHRYEQFGDWGYRFD